MSENNPTLPSFTAKKPPELNETRQRLREANQAASERAAKEAAEKREEIKRVEESSEVQPEPPKRKVVRPKKISTGNKIIIEDNSNLEEKLGVSKRKRFEDVNTRITTYIDNDQLKQLRKIKQQYNVPMTEVIYKALAAYLTT